MPLLSSFFDGGGQDTVRQEGMRALWKGLAPNLVGVVPARAIYFATYSWAKPRLTQSLGAGRETSFVHMFSAATAAFATCTVTNPIWLVKTRMQLSRAVEARGPLAITRDILRTEGPMGFYRGLAASYAGGRPARVPARGPRRGRRGEQPSHRGGCCAQASSRRPCTLCCTSG